MGDDKKPDMEPRLLKMTLLPVFVFEVEGDLVEVQGQAVLSEKEWKELDAEQWAEDNAKRAASQAMAQRAAQNGLVLPQGGMPAGMPPGMRPGQ